MNVDIAVVVFLLFVLLCGRKDKTNSELNKVENCRKTIILTYIHTYKTYIHTRIKHVHLFARFHSVVLRLYFFLFIAIAVACFILFYFLFHWVSILLPFYYIFSFSFIMCTCCNFFFLVVFLKVRRLCKKLYAQFVS